MLAPLELERRWEGDGRRRYFVTAHRGPVFTKQGLEMGAATVVVPTLTDASGRSGIDLRKNLDRAAALLSAAYLHPIGQSEVSALRAADRWLRKGDVSLAQIILAQAGLYRFEDREALAKRLYWAELLLDYGMSPAEMVDGLGLAAPDLPLGKAGFNRDQSRVPRGNPDGGQWTTDRGESPRLGDNRGPPLDALPEVPSERPREARVRAAVLKAVVKWGVRLGFAAADITAPEVLIPVQLGIEAASWAYPYIKAYFDHPLPLRTLQDAVGNSEEGYDVHHIVEQTPAEQDGFARDRIDAPDNLVRIPTLKHWDLNRWYETPNRDFGNLTPRQYIRGKPWEVRREIGMEGLRRIGVLAP